LIRTEQQLKLRCLPDDTDKFPFPISKKKRSIRRRPLSNLLLSLPRPDRRGDGMIVRRGFRKPPSLYDANLARRAVGHFFDVVTNGWGAMPVRMSRFPCGSLGHHRLYPRPAADSTDAGNDCRGTGKPPANQPIKPTPGGQK